MEQWLIRTSTNRLSGPFARDEVIAKIQGGELGPEDEICRANGYWISLHESQELESQLGVRLPRGIPGEEEVTETEIEAHAPESAAGHAARTSGGAEPDGDGMTTVGMMAPPRPPGPPPRPKALQGMQGSARSVPHVVSAAHIERPSVWRGLAWLLIVAACGIVVMVLRVLRAAG